MAALLLVVAAYIAVAVLLTLLPRSGQPGALSTFLGYDLYFWSHVGTILVTLVRLTVVLTTIVAASACLHFSALLIKDFPDPAAARRNGALFLCALRQAAWPMVILLLAGNIPYCFMLSYLNGFKLGLGGILLYMLHAFPDNIPWSTGLFVIWLIALLIALRPKPHIAFIWIICSYSATICSRLSTWPGISAWTDNQRIWGPFATPATGISNLHFGWIVGATLMISLIRIALKGNRGLAYVLGSVMVVASVINLLNINIPDSTPKNANSSYSDMLSKSMLNGISVGVDLLSYADTFVDSEIAVFGVRSHVVNTIEQREVHEYFVSSYAPFNWSVQVAPWVKYPLIAVNAAYLALTIWFIACVLLRQRAGPAQRPS